MPSRRIRVPGRGGATWRCGVCGKRAYDTWRRAAWDAREQRDRSRERRRERAYWSRECGAYHVGTSHPLGYEGKPAMKDHEEDKAVQRRMDDGALLTQAGTAFAVRAVSRDTVELRFGETEELVTVDDLGEMRDRITAVLEGR